MGILNVTPDSFSDGGQHLTAKKAVQRAEEMAAEGADIIDIGGESSRPGARPISVQEELKRVIPVISTLKERLDIPISVDTYKSEVARKALKEGASMINDISALNFDKKMAETVAEFNAGIILMHMRGEPATMQENPSYSDLLAEIFDFLKQNVEKAEDAGIAPDKIIIDPGIGFGKSLENNLEILSKLNYFQSLGKPILAGPSRKTFIGDITGRDIPDREFGTAAALSAAIMNGADIVRVHNVKDMVDACRMTDAIVKGIK
jgi:dihydropteroate synthase